MARKNDHIRNMIPNRDSRLDDNSENVRGEVDTTGDAIGASTGGVAGAATGAALGSLGGPIGTVIGALAGAVGGWWSGRAISEAASTYTTDDDQYYRSHFEGGSTGVGASSGATSRSAASFNDARPAYQLGHLAGMNPDYQGRAFADVEPHLEQAYTSAGRQDWQHVRGSAMAAYDRGRDVGEQRLTLAEEELRVGKRQVQAGEVALHKSVETEHVREQVDLTREEVTIERRPLSADSDLRDVQITDDEIRIPVMAEEAVVEKRVVPKEEVVINKQVRTESQPVEADLRRERLDVDRNVDTSARTASQSGLGGAADRATNSGPLDRLADKVDDVKDRVDGNPASRPGPDATDRRI